jgi:predicted DNA-binding transcriptional regulator AlpA
MNTQRSSRFRPLRLLLEPDVEARTGLTAAEIRRREVRKQFPARIPLLESGYGWPGSAVSHGWLEPAVEGWLAARAKSRIKGSPPT